MLSVKLKIKANKDRPNIEIIIIYFFLPFDLAQSWSDVGDLSFLVS
jgi:hypothetical protein